MNRNRLFRLTALTTALSSVSTAGVVAAQADALGSALCDTGAWQVIALAFTALAFFLIYKGVFQSFIAWDKMNSGRQNDQRDGRDQMSGGLKTFAVGVFGVPIVAFLFDYIGITTFSCVDWAALSPLGGGGSSAFVYDPQTIQTTIDLVITVVA